MKKKINLLFILLVSVVVFGAGCTKDVNSHVGKWEIDYDNYGSAYNDKLNNLTLNEDGTFIWDYNTASSSNDTQHLTGSYEFTATKIIFKSNSGADYSLSLDIIGDHLVYGGYTNLAKVEYFRKTQIAEKQPVSTSQTTSTKPTVTALTATDKAALKAKVTNALKDYNATSIDILTSSKNGSPIASVQLKSLFSFEQINENEIDTFINTITSLIEPISANYNIELVDSNSQLILTKSNDSEIQYAQGVQLVN